MGRMAMPFYILHEGQTQALSGATLGILTFAFTLSGTFSNLLWGPLGDRQGVSNHVPLIDRVVGRVHAYC